MLIKSSRDGANPPLSSEITPREVYEERRQFIARMAVGAAAGSALWEMANRAAFAQGVSTQTPAAQ
jgi:sulfoxide reductase catalytic subunit YedY